MSAAPDNEPPHWRRLARLGKIFVLSDVGRGYRFQCEVRQDVVGRPTNELAAVVLTQQREAVRAALAEMLTAFTSPRQGTPRAADEGWIRSCSNKSRAQGLDGILAVGAQFVGQLLGVADEHAHAMCTLLTAKSILPIPTLTLARSIHESLLLTCWCADSALSTEQRLARAAAITLGSSQENVRALQASPGDRSTELASAREGMTGMQAYLQRHGFALQFGKGGSEFVGRVDFGRAKATTSPNITDASAKYMPGEHYMWIIASGATHSKDWFTAALEGSRSQLAIMVASPVFDYCDYMVDAIGSYVGVDVGEFHRLAHVRRRALLNRAAGRDPRSMVASYEDYAASRDSPVG